MMRGGGGGGGGRGRGRLRREYSPGMEGKIDYSSYGRSSVPPSRHLWVGNLSPHVTKGMLFEQFFRFGDLESIIFTPGRSYAFVNYMEEGDAILALRALQGVVVAGMPLRIDFQKGDKSSSFLDGEYARNRDDRFSVERGESFQQRDSRFHSPENSKSNRIAEPSEVLWIGFPAFLNVDEMVLRRAFSPFGEIEKITAFPGRTYAFVRYRSVVAACRAKEALQGKLFNNPRVSICFARSDSTLPEHERDLANSSFPNHKPTFHLGLNEQVSETAQLDADFDNSIGDFHMVPSRFFSDMGKRPRDVGIDRNNLLEVDALPGSTTGVFENTRFPGLGSERRLCEDPYEHYRDKPLMHQGTLHHDNPVERARRESRLEDSWDSEKDVFPLAKKIRMERFPNDELPEYPFIDSDREKEHAGPTKFFPNLAECQMGNRGFKSMPVRGLHDHLNNTTNPQEDDFWRASNAFNAGPVPVHVNPSKLQMRAYDSQHPINKEWKWEGTIAKGGTPVCRARCFPVGKVLDVMLPEFLDCTARTGLDMLAKHFYQAASSWVVFFVPESDADIVFYNEFMHYLGEKDRAAVAKLGEKTTLFLVPPSEFSEQVLKVPGKVSISGVILRFQQEASNFSGPHHPLEADLSAPPYPSQSASQSSYQNDPQRRHIVHDHVPSQGQFYQNSLSDNTPSVAAFQASNRSPGVLPKIESPLPKERIPNSVGESTYNQHQRDNPSLQPKWPPQDVHVGNANIGSRAVENSIEHEYPSSKLVSMQGTSSSHYPSGNLESLLLASNRSHSHQQEIKSQLPSSAAVPSLQPEQLAQLTALIEQQKRLGKEPVLLSKEDDRRVNLLDKISSQAYASASNPSVPQLNQVQQMQQLSSYAPLGRQAVKLEPREVQQGLPGAKDETENDPQKRLQATLQLAAALLQQIQHQSKSDQQ